MRCGLFRGKNHALLDHPILAGVGLGLAAVGTVAVVSVVRRRASAWGSQMKTAEEKGKKACADLWQDLKQEAEKVANGVTDAATSAASSVMQSFSQKGAEQGEAKSDSATDPATDPSEKDEK